VEDLQRNRDLPVTGVVDQHAATTINMMVETGQREPQRFIVQGIVCLQTGSPVPGVLVKVFDKDLRSEQLLSEAIAQSY
jgi:hypothetical protein